jgi:KAP family P-loop domain/TIR domain
MAVMNVGLLSDEALGEPGGRHDDGLGFGVYARILANGALNASGPLTIGVFGEWGSGKTSLMRLIAREMGHHPRVVTVWFNAWKYEQDQHPIVPLIGTIIRDLEAYEGHGGRVATATRALIRALRAVAYGFSVKSTVKVPGVADVEVSLAGRDVVDRARELREDALLARSLFHEAFEALDAVEFADDLQVVVFIDDLDRCFPDQAVKLLESIKLVLAQRGFVFILGVAREVIEGYLQHRYITEYGIPGYKGHLYLDKMIQVVFHIPPSSGRMSEFSEIILRDQPQELVGQLSDILPIVGKALGGNPRSVIRFVNNLLVDLAINSEIALKSGTTPIPIQFFALSRCLQQRWPEVFAEFLSSDELAVEVAGWDRSHMRLAVSADEGRGAVASSLLSDRELEDLMKSPEGTDWLTNRAMRQASVDFLRTQSRVESIGAGEWAYDAALCYAREDRSDVSLVAEVLADYGLRVLMAHQWTTSSPDEIRASVAGSSKAVLVCIGTAGQVTAAQRAELEGFKATSLKERAVRPRIIPVLLPGSTPESVPEDLRTVAALDIRAGVSVDVLRPIVDALRAS